MLEVTKRSGEKEPFDAVKIQNVLALASDGIRQPMGGGEIRNIAEAVSRKLSSEGSVTSRDVYECVVETLRERGYARVAEAYINDAGNFWNSKK